MSPVSRGRKTKKRKKSAGWRGPARPVAIPDPCDCPACTGQDADLSKVADGLLAGAADLPQSTDPLEVECMAALIGATCELASDAYEGALADGLVPEFEARADTAALNVLLALGSVYDGRVGKAATAAAGRLTDSGVAPPPWAAELEQPPTVGDCWRLADPDGAGSTLISSFHRAGRSHALMVSVDHTDCGAAVNIMMLDTVELPRALEMVQDAGVEVVKERLDPAELRWQVECALDARAVHDGEAGEMSFGEDGLPDFYPLSVLLRARIRTLPDSGKPKPAHAGSVVAPRSLPGLVGAPSRARRPKPKVRTGPAPVYQIKVGLRGATPPIWRRLEVPADLSLARLHLVIQVAFGWDGGHLHVFETPYGDFGIPDPELGHQPADSVSLEDVLPNERDKITYTYDFGDDWRHDIVVEQVLDPDQSVSYPRCTGGRRAAPPDDCGGVWGYGYLLDVLADPSHPEHEERLDWLGLDSAAGFDPAAFDAAAVTRSLAGLR